MSSHDDPSLITNELAVECSDSNLELQGMEVTINNADPRLKSQTLAFNDSVAAYNYEVPSEMESTYGVSDTNDVSLAKFLARPVKIYDEEWSPADPNISAQINPWNLFYEDPRVANRIAHYSLLRSTLKIRVLINGNAFMYGRLMLSYHPLSTFDELYGPFEQFNESQAVLDSQRPHLYLDPCESAGGEMHLPFFWYKNNVHIPRREYASLGILRLRTLNELVHANGGDTPVSVTMFAWAEDVVLGAPTKATVGTLEPQADEYGVGPVSRPATLVSRVASSLSSVPVISKYARATEIAASAVSKVASLAGYCRPTDISTINSFKPVYVGNMANTNVDDTCQKLTVDAKQELTIDPRTVGLSSQDELDISSIAQRESYLTTFQWSTNDAGDDPLFFSAVSPALMNIQGNPRKLFLTPMAFASLPFKYWRGSLKFRFQIVCSNFHRGRIRVGYDPYDNRPEPTDLNVNHSRIIDISQEKDFTVEIGWAQETSYLEVPEGPNEFDRERYGPTFGNTDDNRYSNGTIGLYVMNRLTSPSNLADFVEVNVFVSAGKDFEVAAPNGMNLRNVSYFENYITPPAAVKQSEPNMIVEEIDDENLESQADIVESTSEPSKPMQDQVAESMNAPLDITDYTNHVYFGESIRSFRTMLKRYNYFGLRQPVTSAEGRRIWTVRYPSFPLPRGPMPQPALDGNYGNIVTTTLMSYLGPAFSGWRGGVRWKIVYDPGETAGSASDAYDFPIMIVRGENEPAGGGLSTSFSSSWSQTGDLTADLLANQNAISQGNSGVHLQTARMNPVLEAEIPFYLPYRFYPTRGDWNTNLEGVRPPFFEFKSQYENVRQFPEALFYTAAGEDFNLYFFTGCPGIFFYQNIGSN
jgi:hypothetical protein